MGTKDSGSQELAERWRLAGLVLRRVDPVAFEALLLGAEVIVAETPELPSDISFADVIC